VTRTIAMETDSYYEPDMSRRAYANTVWSAVAELATQGSKGRGQQSRNYRVNV